MAEFKVGDRIRLTDKSSDKTGEWGLRTGVITGYKREGVLYPYTATSDDGECVDYVFAAEEFELVEEEPKPEPAFKVGDLVEYDYSSSWRGGKGKVTGVSESGDRIMVEAIEVPEGARASYPEGNHSSWSPVWLKHINVEAVEHPAHYGGGDNPYEVIKVAEAWGLHEDAYLFNVLKYIARAGKKDANTKKQDLEKGRFYIDRRIGLLD